MSREEPHVVSALVELCKRQNVTCVVQVGADDGYEADAIKEATGCRAVCVEGDTKSVPMSGRLEYHYALIGATDCVTDFYVHTSRGLSSQIKREDSSETKVQARQYRLDTFCNWHLIKPDALLIDTEGTTLDVLEGAGTLLDNMRVIYAECQTQEFRPGMRVLPLVDAFLEARGFVRHNESPAYSGGAQGNYLWLKK